MTCNSPAVQYRPWRCPVVISGSSWCLRPRRQTRPWSTSSSRSSAALVWLYMESVSQANGTAQITVTFESGTSIDTGSRSRRKPPLAGQPRLPSAVTQQGVKVEKTQQHPDVRDAVVQQPGLRPPSRGRLRLITQRRPKCSVPGVGQAPCSAPARHAHLGRPAKLVSFGLSPAEVSAAIRAQNALVPAGLA